MFKDVGTWVVIGSVEVAAAARGMAMYGLAALAADQLFDVPRLKDLPGGKELKRSPVGLLFRTKSE